MLLYHGSQPSRALIRRKIMKKTFVQTNVEVYPVVVTSYEMAMNDRKFIGPIPWKYIIVDEGHRIKNFQCKLIKYVLFCLMLIAKKLQKRFRNRCVRDKLALAFLENILVARFYKNLADKVMIVISHPLLLSTA